MAERNLGGIGSVKAAINMYGQIAIRSSSAQLDLPIVKSSWVAEDLHKSGRGRASESAKAKAEAELSEAKKMVQELTSLIDDSNHSLKSRKIDIDVMKNSKIDGNGRYAEMMRELEDVKQELSKLKLDVAYVLREKSVVEKEAMELGINMEENLKLLESLKLEIDVVNEELVWIELAKIEALREMKEIEEQRERERKEVFDSLEKKKKRMEEMKKEIEKSMEIENVLSETLSDIDMLETQLNLVKEMERNDSKNPSFQRGKDNLSVLKEVTEATEAKIEELASINAEIFCLVNIMDALRQELDQTKQETARFYETLRKDDVIMLERLNSKLLMAKTKLEESSSLADNLASSFEKLKNDREAAKKEEISFQEEAMIIKNEAQKIEVGISGKEKELLDELEKAKHAEILALKKLESMVEKTMETRDVITQRNSTITISRFEYEYLSGQACHAEETAEKKVEAAMAWVEALKASTKAILMKTETLKRESGITMVKEERESFRMQKSLSIKRLIQNEIQKYKKNSEDGGLISPKPVRKSVRLSGKFIPVQDGEGRRYSSGNQGTPTFFLIKKKKTKLPNLVNFFSRKK